MKLFEKIVNFIKRLLGRNLLNETKYLLDNSENESENSIEFIKENIENDIDLEKNISDELIDDSKQIYFDNEDFNAKKDFFEMYEAYKTGKINPENMLITDLIQIELMMQEEMTVLDREIAIVETDLKVQELAIAELEKEKRELKSKK